MLLSSAGTEFLARAKARRTLCTPPAWDMEAFGSALLLEDRERAKTETGFEII